MAIRTGGLAAHVLAAHVYRWRSEPGLISFEASAGGRLRLFDIGPGSAMNGRSTYTVELLTIAIPSESSRWLHYGFQAVV